MALTGIQSVAVYVSDAEKALDFYVNKLGFEKKEDVPMGVADDGTNLRWLTVVPPGSLTEIVLVKGFGEWSEDRIGKFSDFVYNVQDIVGTFEQLKARGVDIIEEPTKQPWGMQAQFKDQDGNTFVVVGE